MTPKEFYLKYWKSAFFAGQKYDIPFTAILVQGAIESGWGQNAPMNNFFGHKDFDGINGNEQLLVTHEYLRSAQAFEKFPFVFWVKEVGKRLFKGKVKDWFKAYKTPQEAFEAHCIFIRKNPRYKKALTYRTDAKRFLTEVARAGYATSPDYEKLCLAVLGSIERIKNEVNPMVS